MRDGSHYTQYGGDTIIKIGFIGPGKVGVSLARYFIYKNITVTGFYGKNRDSVESASKITNTTAFKSLDDIVESSDIIFITTPDDIIPEIDKLISKYNLTGKTICHASGSLGSDVLSNAEISGALVYSIHPMFAFSDKFTDTEKLNKIYFSVEGKNTSDNTDTIRLLQSLGNKFFVRDKNLSAEYHLASVMVSNLALSLFNIGGKYLEKLGISKSESFEALLPLIQGNIENIYKNGYKNSLTGPIARGDITPVKKHLNVLDQSDKNIYSDLSLNLIRLVSDRESVSFDKLISESEKYSEIYKLLGGKE